MRVLKPLSAGLCFVVLAAIQATASPLLPASYAFTGIFTGVSEFAAPVVPGITVGSAFFGTLIIAPYDQDLYPGAGQASLDVLAGDQEFTAYAVGQNPLNYFAPGNCCALGPRLVTPSNQGYLDEITFAIGLTPDGALGTFGVLGTFINSGVPHGSMFFGLTGELNSLVLTPEPSTFLLMAIGIIALAAVSKKRVLIARHAAVPSI